MIELLPGQRPTDYEEADNDLHFWIPQSYHQKAI